MWSVPVRNRRIRSGRAATLVIEPFEPLADEDREALTREGERPLRFVAEGAGTVEVRFAR